ncbi:MULTISPECIES: hypothetical protein [Acinetobacter]|uniref:Uncharacterized protein n=2 Tax=Acinetobacter TaxID=469 RepID=A0A4Q7B0Z1_9GAMM|nr:MULTISPECIES: hypothetical protein [Acinetobacter]MCW8037782.1 hypothetical protein [Acinetobacter entericus]RZG68714.1 hypothetical protein EXE25_03280 [Acinetobacter bouvetii]TCB75654.1 hypothetical protein E0H91_04445 [Acinetobacter sp. ANC 4177]
MPYSDFDIDTLKARLEQARLASFIYLHNRNMLTLQDALNENGAALNNFAQHELTADQIGLQFGLRLSDGQWQFMIGLTHSNQDSSYEIGAGNLKGDQRAFNLLYAFYNYPKGFYTVSMPLASNAQQLEDAIEQQLLSQLALSFLNSAVKTNPTGQQVQWMKSYLIQEALNMKVRIQTALL